MIASKRTSAGPRLQRESRWRLNTVKPLGLGSSRRISDVKHSAGSIYVGDEKRGPERIREVARPLNAVRAERRGREAEINSLSAAFNSCNPRRSKGLLEGQ